MDNDIAEHLHRQDVGRRFFAHVQKSPHSKCVIWTGAKSSSGNGVMRVNSGLKRVTHVSWWLRYGQWPTMLKHTCRQKLCVNYAHLVQCNRVLGEQRRGERVFNSKLTDDDVREIYALCRDSELTYPEIAAKFDVAPNTINLIRVGVLWPHLWPGEIKKRTRGKRITELAAKYGVTEATIRNRLRTGRPLDKGRWEK